MWQNRGRLPRAGLPVIPMDDVMAGSQKTLDAMVRSFVSTGDAGFQPGTCLVCVRVREGKSGFGTRRRKLGLTLCARMSRVVGQAAVVLAGARRAAGEVLGGGVICATVVAGRGAGGLAAAPAVAGAARRPAAAESGCHSAGVR